PASGNGTSIARIRAPTAFLPIRILRSHSIGRDRRTTVLITTIGTTKTLVRELPSLGLPMPPADCWEAFSAMQDRHRSARDSAWYMTALARESPTILARMDRSASLPN